jgi:putative ABC transport system permease protein
LLCVLAAACSVTLFCAILLLGGTISDSIIRNARGIDVVVGAKGSPLQLVLSTIYHADIPTGNISGASARIIKNHPQIRKSIPLALGDSINGFRIVGTSPDYIELYGAKFADGRLWNAPMEAVAGAHTGFKTGDLFAGAHGLMDGGEAHSSHPYKVTGTLTPTGTIIDRLILTSVHSVYEIHRVLPPVIPEEKEDADHHDHAHGHEHDVPVPDDTHDSTPHAHGADIINHPVTALLIFTIGPLDRVNLPREINRTSNLMAASPSYEITRLMQRVGIGRQTAVILGTGLGVLAVLMIFAAVATGLSARRHDLAVLRVLGGSPGMLLCAVMTEGILLALCGGLLGIVCGHGLAWYAATSHQSLGGLVSVQGLLIPGILDIQILAATCMAGALAALVPALLAARTNIADILARGHG